MARLIADKYREWEKQCEERFERLKENEEELNRIFIDLYGLEDELAPEVEDKYITVRRAHLQREIKSLISYAVGCIFGRYSLDEEGVIYAGGEWDISRYKTVIPVKDNIIPICDDECFENDITEHFIKWVETVYGSETLEENLSFIADGLEGKGTPREVIRCYFLNTFYADHVKTYQKRPIYWMFSSGRKNGFKALVYMHRYKNDLPERMHKEYVCRRLAYLSMQAANKSNSVENVSSSEKNKTKKQMIKLEEQFYEAKQFDEKLLCLAEQKIEIDLDDGVKVNYEKFADVLEKIR